MKLKIGLTAVAVQGDVMGSLWANGMLQNLVYMAMLLQRIRIVEQVYIVPMPEVAEPHQPSVAFGLKQIGVQAALETLDVLIEIGMRIPTEQAQAFQARGGKLVSYVAGNSFIMTLEAVASNLHERAEVLPPMEYDAAWITPQHWHTNASYTRMTKTPQVHKVGQIWDPIVLRQGVARVQHNFFYKRRLKPGCSVGVFEPNVNVLKTFHIPLLVCEQAFRQKSDTVHHVFCSGLAHLAQNTHIVEFFAALDLQRRGKVTAEARFPVFELLGQYVDTVVTHQWENGLNYLYYDVLYGGYPLVHNSTMLQGAGYAYDAFDVHSGARALQAACEGHDDGFDEYHARSQELLWTVSPDNPLLQRQHAVLLDALYG